MMNCKPGDLAIVVAATYTPEMIGCIVEVKRIAVHGEYHIETTDEPTWICESKNPNGIAVRYLSGTLKYEKERPIADSILRPISGIPDTEDADIEQPIKEVA